MEKGPNPLRGPGQSSAYMVRMLNYWGFSAFGATALPRLNVLAHIPFWS